jgi:hypothetical protein
MNILDISYNTKYTKVALYTSDGIPTQTKNINGQR